jgi:hypothetical protein
MRLSPSHKRLVCRHRRQPLYFVEKLGFAFAAQADCVYEASALRSTSHRTNHDRSRDNKPLRGSGGDRCDERDSRPAKGLLSAARLNRVFQQNSCTADLAGARSFLAYAVVGIV